MTILIVDDSEDKINALRPELMAWHPSCTISVAKSFQGGIRALKQVAPDLVLLDMTLPTSEHPDGRGGGRKRLYGGREILTEMEFEEMRSKVIIFTQFDSFPGPSGSTSLKSLLVDLKKDYPSTIIGGVYFSNVDSAWKDDLLDLLNSF